MAAASALHAALPLPHLACACPPHSSENPPLASVPASLSALTGLKRMWLDRNPSLRSLPVELTALNHLQVGSCKKLALLPPMPSRWRA